VALVFMAISWTSSFSLAQTPSGAQVAVSEERLKAASLYKFPNYIGWPAQSFSKPDSPFVFGVLGADDIADALTGFAIGRTINNRPVVVKKLQADGAFNDIHALFIGKAERDRQAQLLKQLQGRPILVVTETEGALTQGSMINFRIVDDHVRFEVAIDPVDRSGLVLDSRILSVALHVLKGSQE